MTTIIAEIGPNHDGNLTSAMGLIDAAHECGADVVKFQAHIAEAESLKDAPPPPYFQKETPFNFFKRTAFDKDQMSSLKRYAEAKGMQYLCSPFSLEAVDILEEIGVSAYKIASGEVTNIPLLEKVASTGKAVYLSSGMSNYEELDKAVEVLKGTGLTLMQCSSLYPCPYNHVGLGMIKELNKRYHRPVGLSDHTVTGFAAIAAVAMGAVAVEKHFTLTNKGDGPDFWFSMIPDAFRAMVVGVRATEAMMQPIDKNDIGKYKGMKQIFQKSIVAVKDIQKGDAIDGSMIAFKKPGDGLSPEYHKAIIGKKAKRNVAKDTAIRFEDIDWAVKSV